MPLRKAHQTLPAAVLAISLVGAAVPGAASAGILTNLFKPKASATATSSATPQAAATTGSCTPLPTTKAFQKIDGDTADYSLAPAGDFESGAAGWTLSGSAAVAAGNESLGAAGGSRSLRMPIGATATSPAFCIDETNPHFRFAYKVDNVGAAGFIAHVVYRDARGAVTKTELLSSTKLSLTPSRWQASPNSPLATIVPLDATTKAATVQLKFSVASPANLGSDVAAAVLGDGALSGLVRSATGVADLATNIGTGLASNLVNVGVTIDSVMVDPYRRG